MAKGKRNLYVFIAGPYTGGDVAVNVAQAMRMASSIRAAGYTVFCPHLYHFMHMQEPAPYTDWTEMDLAWLEKCDALIRLPGESPGADGEVARAGELDIPVLEAQEPGVMYWELARLAADKQRMEENR